jgi:hypothetical protein
VLATTVGITHFVAHVRGENRVAQRALARHWPAATSGLDEHGVRFEVPLGV